MKRWLLTIEGNNYRPKIYAESAEQAANFFKNEADYIPKKCSCPCFVNGDDLWIKHRDFFSESFRPPVEDMGAPLGYILEKYFPDLKRHTKDFIYADTWGDVVLRNEAWIVFRNFGQVIRHDRHRPIQSLIKSFLKADIIRKTNIESLSNDWYRFFENVIQKYNEFIKKGNS